MGQRLREDRLEHGLRFPMRLGKEPVVGAPIFLALAEPVQRTGDGFEFRAAQQAQGQRDELAAGAGIAQGQRGQSEQVTEGVPEGSVHTGRVRRSKVLGAVRTKVW